MPEIIQTFKGLICSNLIFIMLKRDTWTLFLPPAVLSAVVLPIFYQKTLNEGDCVVVRFTKPNKLNKQTSKSPTL